MCTGKKALKLHANVRCKTHKMNLETVVLIRFQRRNCVTSLTARSKSFQSICVVQVDEKTMAVGRKLYRM
jgi:hypothetical protein